MRGVANHRRQKTMMPSSSTTTTSCFPYFSIPSCSRFCLCILCIPSFPVPASDLLFPDSNTHTKGQKRKRRRRRKEQNHKVVFHFLHLLLSPSSFGHVRSSMAQLSIPSLQHNRRLEIKRDWMQRKKGGKDGFGVFGFRRHSGRGCLITWKGNQIHCLRSLFSCADPVL